MDQFVCVRLVQANAMDLSLFQFDYDLTFAVIMMNADRTVYGRYGSRSSRQADRDISLEGFAAALAGAMQLHAAYPANKSSLAGKQPVPTHYKSPDDFPSLRGKFKSTLDYEGKVVQSCMHCHQIRDAHRAVFRTAGKPIPDKLLFPYPSPQVLGLTLDPQTKATVKTVAANSVAAQHGMVPGDEIVALNDQPILSSADVQWVLHNAQAGPLVVRVQRGGQPKELTIPLEKDWRRASDISWRVSSWPLRRMGLGGLVLDSMTLAERRDANLDVKAMALRVKHVGQYGAHAVAKHAGIRKGDILIGFGDLHEDMTESQLLAYTAQHTTPNQHVPLTIMREGKSVDVVLKMQD